ncbi:VWA domain-containing protein [Flavobacterium sediminilitoris]|uniref:VWA domain-containing protein n=1 Tax=Flavobacterium sediminilitoris TaxID=2024526 RepID=A0ABY4HSQ6_9FLAO|nr:MULTISPECIES: VWA domain-containing protein [Flavobacterium]UOX34804.1 VWA domain-containing protein [Flavobacterium sediminilitoris]
MYHKLEEPILLYLLLLIPLLIALFLFQVYWKKKKQKEFGDLELIKQLSPTKSRFKPVLKFVTILLALTGLILALVNPKIGTKMETVKRQGIDIVFALDISKSMLSEDIAPSRLEKSKQLISQIINSLGNDRIGIVGYAGSAYPVLPMTTDYSIAKMYLQNMNTNMLSSQGTALNDAINLATTYFDAVDTSKLIILVSDGEDHGDGANEASEIAKEKGIKIITIGVGTVNGGTIPIKADNGVIAEYKKDNNGEVVITKLNPTILENIAKNTNAVYIENSNTKQVVEQVKNVLDNIEKTEFESQEIAEYQTQYQWFIGIAFFLLFLDIFFLERKTSWLQRLNLFNER